MSQALAGQGSGIPRVILRRFLLASGNFFFWFRSFFIPLTCILLTVLTRPALFWGNPRLDQVAIAVGIVIALAGQAVRLLVVGFAYIKRGGKDRRVYATELVTEGFYAHSRNPMYVGDFLILLGVTTIYGPPWGYFVVIPLFIFVYVSIILAEEHYLRNKFGAEYETYVARVNRFWPNLRGLKNSFRGYRYDWKKVLRKEYGTVSALLVSLVLVYGWKRYWIYGLSDGEVLIGNLLCFSLCLFFSIAWCLKKAGALH